MSPTNVKVFFLLLPSRLSWRITSRSAWTPRFPQMQKSFRGKTTLKNVQRHVYLQTSAADVYLNHLRSYKAGAGPFKQPVGSSVLLPQHELQRGGRQVQGDHQIREIRDLFPDFSVAQLFVLIHDQFAFPLSPLPLQVS